MDDDMNEKKEYLNEDRYQKNKKKIANVALIVLLIGLLIGGSLIFIGVKKQSEVDSYYSDEDKSAIAEQLEVEKENLEAKKAELEAKGVKYNVSAKYTDGKSYDLMIITNVLDPSFSWYMFDEYKNNPLTAKYCSLKVQLEDNSNAFNKEYDKTKSIPFYMIGGFIIIASCMISAVIYFISKGREITAFETQQVMPVAKEGMEEMAPTVAKVASEMAPTMAKVASTVAKEAAPAYGEMAKEIAKGVKEGMKEEKEEDKK